MLIAKKNSNKYFTIASNKFVLEFQANVSLPLIKINISLVGTKYFKKNLV